MLGQLLYWIWIKYKLSTFFIFLFQSTSFGLDSTRIFVWANQINSKEELHILMKYKENPINNLNSQVTATNSFFIKYIKYKNKTSRGIVTHAATMPW